MCKFDNDELTNFSQNQFEIKKSFAQSIKFQ